MPQLAKYIQNDKGKWRWTIPREGPDVTPLNRFDSENEAIVDFLDLRRKLAAPWIKGWDASKQEGIELELERDSLRKYEKLYQIGLDSRANLLRWLLVLGIALLSQAIYIVTLLR